MSRVQAVGRYFAIRRPGTDAQVARTAAIQVRHLARNILEGQAHAPSLCRQHSAERSEANSFARALDELRLHRGLEPVQALAQSRRRQAERLGGAAHVAVLGDDAEILDIAELHELT